MPCNLVELGNFTERETRAPKGSEGNGARENFEVAN